MKNSGHSVRYFLVTVFAIAPMVGMIYYFSNHRPSVPPVVPTQTIDTTQRMGGNPQAATDDHVSDGVASSKSAQPTTPGAPSAPQPSTATAPIPATFTSAPKQAEIARSIAKEYKYHALQAPNDPMYGTFTDTSGTTHTPFSLQKIGAPTVWDTTTGSPIVVAVIDTGYALQHEDLRSQWHINAAETGKTAPTDHCWTGTSIDKATNNCDDDSNGYTDDWRGWNFMGSYTSAADPCAGNSIGVFTPNNNPQAGTSNTNGMYQDFLRCVGVDYGDPYAGISHGTSTAGISGAASNNGLGIATLNWNVKLMPLQALADDGSGWTSGIVAAIYYAVDNGAQVINMSLGGDADDPALAQAIEYAYARNVVVVAAAGNCGTGYEFGCDPSKPGAMAYPALNNHVLAVGATDKNNMRASFSSYGPGLDVVAPGYGEIIAPLITRPPDANGNASRDLQTFNYTSGYSAGLAGTSFASPYVANAVSLIKAVKPSYTVDDVTALVDGSAQKIPAMNGAVYADQYGHGLINAHQFSVVAKRLSPLTDSPILAQTGDHRSEHSFSPSATMSSGCTVASSGYCTIWLQSITNGYDRYLPYSTADSGKLGWHWGGGILYPGEWSVRAVQGENVSGSYYLFSK